MTYRKYCLVDVATKEIVNGFSSATSVEIAEFLNRCRNLVTNSALSRKVICGRYRVFNVEDYDKIKDSLDDESMLSLNENIPSSLLRNWNQITSKLRNRITWVERGQVDSSCKIVYCNRDKLVAEKVGM